MTEREQLLKIRPCRQDPKGIMTKLSKEATERFFETYSEMEKLIEETLVPSLSSFPKADIYSIEIEGDEVDVLVEDSDFHCKCGHCHPDTEHLAFPSEAFYDTENWIKQRLELKRRAELKEQEEKKRKEKGRLEEKEKEEKKLLEKLKNKYPEES